MKRFWTQAESVAGEGGWAIELDGRPLRTPGRAPLIVPGEALASAIATEWNDAGDTVDPRAMPLTGITNAAIDRVAPHREAFAAGLAKYAEGELACYRAESPAGLATLQRDSWDPLLGWARRRFDVDFNTTTALLHVPQPPATVDRLAHALAVLDPFRLAGLSPLVTIGGSLVAALGVLEGAFTAAAAWEAVCVDERWQREQWGADTEAEAALASRRHDFFAAASFLKLLDL